MRGNFGSHVASPEHKMIFPCLDCAFGGVAAVAVGRDALEVDVIFLEGFLEFVGAFVVEDVKGGRVAIGLKARVQAGPGGYDFARLACFQRMGEDGVAVVIIEDHDVLVAAR